MSLTPTEIHQVDQLHAQANEVLDGVIRNMRAELERLADTEPVDNVPAAVTMLAGSVMLQLSTGHPALLDLHARVFTLAVYRLMQADKQQ